MACGECGGSFELSARIAREHRRRGTSPRCRECRRQHSAVKVTPAMRAYWLDRYSIAEIRELAAGLDIS